jgi:hypothetical protein
MLFGASSTLAADNDAEKTRAEISSIETVLPRIADRGAGLFLLARRYAHVGDQAKALELLKECMSLEAGFDPSDSPSLQPLRPHPEFVAMAEQAARQYPPVHHATVAFDIPTTDLFPEGLAVDAANGTFYMGSMHHKKIVSFTLSGPVKARSVRDFVKEGPYELMPVGGVHVDPADHSPARLHSTPVCPRARRYRRRSKTRCLPTGCRAFPRTCLAPRRNGPHARLAWRPGGMAAACRDGNTSTCPC